MTDTERNQIIRLRGEGYSYIKIATVLSLKENTVKSFCKRRGLGGLASATKEPTLGEEHECLNCGLPIRQVEGRKEKKFCSDKCRMEWWKEHPTELNRKAIYYYTCPQCKKPFTAYGNKTRKYCCHECYIEARFGGGSDE